MSGRFVVGVVSFFVFMISGFLTNMFFGSMIEEINRAKQEEISSISSGFRVRKLC